MVTCSLSLFMQSFSASQNNNSNTKSVNTSEAAKSLRRKDWPERRLKKGKSQAAGPFSCQSLILHSGCALASPGCADQVLPKVCAGGHVEARLEGRPSWKAFSDNLGERRLSKWVTAVEAEVKRSSGS